VGRDEVRGILFTDKRTSSLGYCSLTHTISLSLPRSLSLSRARARALVLALARALSLPPSRLLPSLPLCLSLPRVCLCVCVCVCVCVYVCIYKNTICPEPSTAVNTGIRWRQFRSSAPEVECGKNIFFASAPAPVLEGGRRRRRAWERACEREWERDTHTTHTHYTQRWQHAWGCNVTLSVPPSRSQL